MSFAVDAAFTGTEWFTYSVSDADGDQATGTVTLTVTGGSSMPNRPQVSGLMNNSGSTSGGTTVMIFGAGFGPATQVLFGSAQAAAFRVNSDSSITAVAPPHDAESVDVTVVSADGTSTPSTADRFTYAQSSQVSALNDVVYFQVDSSSPTVALHVFDNDSATHQSQLHFVGLTQPSVGTIGFQSDDPATVMSMTWSESDPTATSSTPLPFLVYTPPGGFEGQQTFQYTLADDAGVQCTATVTVIVQATHAANSGGSTGTESGTGSGAGSTGNGSGAGSTGTGTTGAGAIGSGSTWSMYGATYGVTLPTFTAPDVTLLHRPPVAVSDGYIAVHHGQTATFSASQLLANDVVFDGKSLHITHVTSGSAEVSMDASGNITFHAPEEKGIFDFTYTMSDGEFESNVATAQFKVTNQPPQSMDMVMVLQNGTTLSYSGYLMGPFDPDGDAISIVDVGISSGGASVSVSGMSVQIGTPSNDWEGTVTVTYSVSDGVDTAGPYTATFVITHDLAAYCAAHPASTIYTVNDSATWVGDSVAGNVLANDRDLTTFFTQSPSTLAVDTASIAAGQYGTLSMQADGSYAYAVTTGQEANFIHAGGEKFGLTVRNAAGDTKTETLWIKPTILKPREGAAGVQNSPVAPYGTSGGDVGVWVRGGTAHLIAICGNSFNVSVGNPYQTLNADWSGGAEALTLSATGNILSDLSFSYVSASAGGNIGNVSGGTVSVSAGGHVGAVTAGGTVLAVYGRNIQSVTSDGDVRSVMAMESVGSISAQGVLGTVSAGSTGTIFAEHGIHSITVQGDVNGNISAGSGDLGYVNFGVAPPPDSPQPSPGTVHVGGKIFGSVTADGSISEVSADLGFGGKIEAGQSLNAVLSLHGSVDGAISAADINRIEVGVSLSGAITSQANIGFLSAGELILGDIQAARTIGGITAHTIASSEISAGLSIGWIRTNAVDDVGGDLLCDAVTATVSIGSVIADGMILADLTAAQGFIGEVNAGTNITKDITAAQYIGDITAGGNLSGEVTAGTNIGIVDVGGNITQDLTAATGHITDVYSGGSIAGNIAAGTFIGNIATGANLDGKVDAGTNIGFIDIGVNGEGNIT